MTSRRGRISHVRPRPPSTGRAPEPSRIKAPDPFRVRQYRGLDARRRATPAPARFSLAVGILALAVIAFVAASGSVGPLAAAFGAGFSGVVKILTVSPEPQAPEIVPTTSPIIASPANPYTNQPTVELRVTLPAGVAGSDDAKVRMYLALEGVAPAPIAEVPIGSTTRLSVLVGLTTGRNDFSATIIRQGAESEQSPVVTYILDQDPPTITLSTPSDGVTLSDANVGIVGTTEPGTNLISRNEANGTSATALADADGAFTMSLPLVAGPNGIRIDATDRATNTSNLVVSVLQGSGQLTASLSASTYRISASAPPAAIQLTVVVTDPTGAPLEGASAFFTLQVPGLAPISNDLTTGADGRAVFTAQLVGAVSTGSGAGTVVVSHESFGQTTDGVAIAFVP
ncbi:MAG TPA: hypothetical protein VEX41_08710 [Candidatus Eisenbacteria bacterium]|nr:hypothetical protein [Candidatus Eisenbacteria bacterium]